MGFGCWPSAFVPCPEIGSAGLIREFAERFAGVVICICMSICIGFAVRPEFRAPTEMWGRTVEIGKRKKAKPPGRLVRLG